MPVRLRHWRAALVPITDPGVTGMSERYPESEKLTAASEEREAIIDFLAWMEAEGLHVCQVGEHGWSQPRWMPAVESFDALALRFLGVDPVRLEAERRAMLAAIGGGGA